VEPLRFAATRARVVEQDGSLGRLCRAELCPTGEREACRADRADRRDDDDDRLQRVATEQQYEHRHQCGHGKRKLQHALHAAMKQPVPPDGQCDEGQQEHEQPAREMVDQGDDAGDHARRREHERRQG
jgi:hypothetical protein